MFQDPDSIAGRRRASVPTLAHAARTGGAARLATLALICACCIALVLGSAPAPSPEHVNRAAPTTMLATPPPPTASPIPPRSSDRTIAPTRPALPAAPDAAPRWFALITAADAGAADAACRLGLMLDDCRLVADVDAMIDTQIAMAAQGEVDPAQAEREIGALQASVEAQRAVCGALPADLPERAWRYLMHAAIAGHEPSMYRFVIDPPLPSARSAEFRAALRAWHANAPLLLGSLLQRGSPESVALAFRAAQGEVFLDGQALLPRDPATVVRLGTALIALREDDVASLLVVERALSELSRTAARRALYEGQRLTERLLQPAPALARADGGDECRAGWPGMESAYLAYSY
jgi:TPR repeat protein